MTRPDETSSWFWTLIADAAGDRERLRDLAGRLSRRELHEAYEIYRQLASWVTSSEIDEDRAVDLANWIVAQGKDYYFDVYYERRTPPEEPEGPGDGFLSIIIRVFMERFGSSISAEP